MVAARVARARSRAPSRRRRPRPAQIAAALEDLRGLEDLDLSCNDIADVDEDARGERLEKLALYRGGVGNLSLLSARRSRRGLGRRPLAFQTHRSAHERT